MKLPTRNLSLLGRLFGRTDNSTIAKVHTYALGRPLLVHPGMGEQLVGAYMHGAVDTPPVVRMDVDAAPGAGGADEATAGTKVAIINISGALVNRPMPDVCGPGPLSYLVIGQVLDAALADTNVKAVVLRLDSCGGMASGLFDLTDHIFASRGTKRLIAMVDDLSFSACYAIAAACDEVWVTRTGQVGSVGVVCYHGDYSAADAKAGLKVTAIYAGAQKIDFSGFFALSPEAQERAQLEINGLYALFVQSVATYRGLDAEAVRATEAGTYTGQAAVDVGFATHLGTMQDMLASLSAAPPAEPEPVAAADDDIDDVPDDTAPAAPVAAEDPNVIEMQAKAALSDALAASSLPGTIQAALLKRSVAIEQVAPALAAAAAIVDLCVAAKVPDLAADFVQNGASVEKARADLAGIVADPGPELVTALPIAGTPGAPVAAGPWGETIKRFGG